MRHKFLDLRRTMAGGKITARTKKASPAKASAKSARASKTAAKPSARSRQQTARPKTAAKSAKHPAPAAAATRSSAQPLAAVPHTGASAIDRLQQVALTATNLDASVDFYRDVLGLRFITRFDPPGLAFFNLGSGVRLLLSATASRASLYFQVEDVEAAVKELRGRGVRFLQQPQMIQRDEAGDFGKKGVEEWMAFFKDPADNMLALVERR
jgi:methylmalonyl-CoA/ethylmalonyl-CoA epimerase